MDVSQYKHIIWDWNGTLLNDLSCCVECVNLALKQRDLPYMSEKKYQDEFDFPVIDFYHKLGFDYKKDSFESLAVEYHEYYNARWPNCYLQEGAIEALEKAKALGIQQSILSAAQQEMLDAGVDHFKLRDYFVRVIGLENNQAHGKIDNGIAWMNEIHHEPHDVLFIGDTVHDHEVAVEIGADCALVVSGHHRRDKLETCGIEVFDSLNQIFELNY